MSRLEPWVVTEGKLSLLPVCHYRLEFAELARLQFRADPPEILALELPSSLAAPYLTAVRRLPEVSILLTQVSAETHAKRTLYLPVEPVDPFAEAARLAIDQGVSVHLIDINLEDPYPSFQDHVPDPYALLRIGPEVFFRAWASLVRPEAGQHPLDVRREQGMAFRLQELLETGRKVLFVCGALHWPGILENLKKPQATPLEQRHAPPTQVFHLHPSCLDEVMATFPFLSAVYETRRNGLPPEPAEDRVTVRRRFEIRANPFLLLGKQGPVFDEHEALKASLARVARRAGLTDNSEMSEAPIDRGRVNWFLFQEAARHYREETGEVAKPWQKKVFWRFVRNYAVLEGCLLPDYYHLLSGARACVGDNFAYDFLRLGRFYPWQKESSGLPTIKASADEVWLGSRKLRVRRWLPHRKRTIPRSVRKGRKREMYPGEWLESFDGSTLCSYPPEDLVVENYGQELRESWSRLLRDEQDQTEPFTSSVEEGIDIRQTLRNWASEQRLYVKTRRRTAGRAGAVVVVFEEDERDERFPYRMTWLGEHEQESDMAFYATAPEENIVGPGICRCEYGGFLMTYPPRRLYDVWRDPDYRLFRTKSEKLLAAGIDYSLERWVIYVASRPPHSLMRTLAEKMQRQIVYIPIGSLSPSRLSKIRTFHILSGYDKRGSAKDYIP